MRAKCPNGHSVVVVLDDDDPIGLIACYTCRLYFDPFGKREPAPIPDDEIEIED